MATPPLAPDPVTSKEIPFSCLLDSALFHFMCMNVLPEYMSMQYMHGWYSQKSKEGAGSSETGITVVTCHMGPGNEPESSR